MSIYYYLTVFPMEALVASQLDPEAYGAYMAVGARKGSAERLMFFEVSEAAVDASDAFDGEYARSRCIPHADGRPKNSVYLSVYRTLEHMDPDGMGKLWLVNKDGRSLALGREPYAEPSPWPGYALYKELCPASPLVVSALDPIHFADHLISGKSKVTMPALVFADVMVPDLEDTENTGNVGGYFDKNLDHLRGCIGDIQNSRGKLSKVVDRSFETSFSYQVIDRGVYVASGSKFAFYRMPGREELKDRAYDWGKSALIF